MRKPYCDKCGTPIAVNGVNEILVKGVSPSGTQHLDLCEACLMAIRQQVVEWTAYLRSQTNPPPPPAPVSPPKPANPAPPAAPSATK